MTLNARWQLGVGPIETRDHLPAIAGAVDSIAIVSWNVHVGGGDFSEFVRDLRAGRLTGGAPVEQFVMLVQESFRSGDAVPHPMPPDAAGARAIRATDSHGERYDANALARENHLCMTYAPSMRNGREANAATGMCEDRGNAIFSTLQLTDVAPLELPMLHQRRVALFARVGARTSQGKAWSLQVGSVHLDLRASPRGRAAQARAIVAAADPVASVVAGDLNPLPLFETAPAILRAAFPETDQGDDLPTRGGIFRNKIDFQFYRLPAEYRAAPYHRVASRYHSDHNPQLGFVSFLPGSETKPE